jgi:reductive dehalogenase
LIWSGSVSSAGPDEEQLGPFPMHRLKRVDHPTTAITDAVQRIDARDEPFNKAQRGDYGEAVQRDVAHLLGTEPINAAQVDVIHYLASIADNEVAEKAPIPTDPTVLSRHIKRLGYFLGADIVGICRLPQYAIYSHDPSGKPLDLDYPNAIVIVRRKDHQMSEASTGTDLMGTALSFQAYLPCAFIAHTMSNYLRRLGFRAAPQHAGRAEARRYQVILPPLLLVAGIGEVSRAGIILNPFLGLEYKASVVLTDIPLQPDKPIDFGLQDFCRRCKICAAACPSRAISDGEKVIYNGYETWKLDQRRCASFSISNPFGTQCNTCVKVCPWSRPNTWPHDPIRWLVEHSGLARKMAINADQVWRRLRPEQQKDRWWFNLEYRDDRLEMANRPVKPK